MDSVDTGFTLTYFDYKVKKRTISSVRMNFDRHK